ncbi:hypothetical protein MMC20_000320 [Loxospora ochrophaea]|nr:hypothetical protein [Loxospora ochrophaea]
MLESIVRTIPWPDYWTIDHVHKTLELAGDTLEQRNERMAETLRQERKRGQLDILSGWRDELYPVYNEQREVVLSIERAGSALFGITIYGVHMTAYVKSGAEHKSAEESLMVWVARRSKSKPTYPGMLDNTVGGGMATGEEPFETVVRETTEEASFPVEHVRQHAKSRGCITYFDIRDERAGGETGLLQPECIYVYDLEVKTDMMPSPEDHEAEKFMLWDVRQVKNALRMGEFKTNCALVLIDFLIRHGLITPEEENDYIEILARLHRKLDFPTR